MTDTQIKIAAVLWVLALLPIASSLLLPTRVKISAWASIIGFLPGIGAGFAIAGIWIGILGMNAATSSKSYFEIASIHIWSLLLIVVCAPAIAMIVVFCMFLYFSGKELSPDAKTNTNT